MDLNGGDLDVGGGDLNGSRRNLVGFRLISLNSDRISMKSGRLSTDVIEIWSELRLERGGVQLDRLDSIFHVKTHQLIR